MSNRNQFVADVAVLPGVRRPSAVGLKSDEIRRTILIGDLQRLPE